MHGVKDASRMRDRTGGVTAMGSVMKSNDPLSSPMALAPKRVLFGRPMSTQELGETLLPKRLALPVFCSDAISSNAYATQEILLVLAIGGASFLGATPWIALVVCGLLLIVMLSYRQTCYAYPNGGGAYAVSRANLGQGAALVAAAALLVDYVLTVAVSIASAVQNLASALPWLTPHTVVLCLAFILIITLVNLRGVRETGTAFAIPTYGFIICVYAMLITGFAKALFGHAPVAETAGFPVHSSESLGGALMVLLLLRAFASGCTALTGVEAVSNGVPSFRKPKSRNAAITLLLMALLSVGMMAGIAVLSTIAHVHMSDPASGTSLVGAPAGYVPRTVLAQLAASVFGNNSIGFFAVQVTTALILALAANTAYNGFPILASILAQDRFMPRQLARRGDRLVFSNGIIILAACAAALIVVFDGSVTRLIQLYIVGVFVSFTLSQFGMVRHWTTQRATTRDPAVRRRIRGSQVINLSGAVCTAVVLVIVLVTKFTHGAWMVAVTVPVIVWLMYRIHAHYARVRVQTTPKASGMTLPSRIHAVVLVSDLNEPALKALAFARAIRPSTLTAVHVDTDADETHRLIKDWQSRDIDVKLSCVASPYRELSQPVIDYLQEMPVGPRDAVEVFVPEYVVGRARERLLHNQSALRLRARLSFLPGVMVTTVPYQLESARPLVGRAPGSERPDADLLSQATGHRTPVHQLDVPSGSGAGTAAARR